MTANDAATLRLYWPQWQGATPDMATSLAPELGAENARFGYVTGTSVLAAVLPEHNGPTATVPVTMDGDGTGVRDGVHAKEAVLRQLGAALDIIAKHSPARIVTIGGECSVSVAPFTSLALQYGDDLAVIWIDAHPDLGTPDSDYPGYHAMAVSTITGHGDPEVNGLLPAIVPTRNVALAGLHSWTDDDIPHVEEWGIASFGPDDLRSTTAPLLSWLAATGCSRVALHIDVDVVDSDELTLGLGAEPGGLSLLQLVRIVTEISAQADVVGLTIAEYIPRQVIQLRSALVQLPLLGQGG